MARGATLTVEIPKSLMKSLTLVTQIERRPLPAIVKEFLNEGLGQWGWSKWIDDQIEYVEKHNPPEEEKQEMFHDFVATVHECMDRGKKKKKAKEA